MGSRAAAPKGTMPCKTQGDFRLFVRSFVPPLASKLKFQPQGSNSSLKTQIPASRLKSQPQGSNPSLEAQISASKLESQPQGLNPHHEAQIPASRLKYQPQCSNLHTQMDGRMNYRKSPSVLQNIIPFRAAALLPITQNHQHTQQGSGYR